MKFVHFLTETTFVATRKDKTLIEIPTLAFALLMLLFWETLVPVLIIALFFDVGYFFVGDFSKEDHGHEDSV